MTFTMNAEIRFLKNDRRESFSIFQISSCEIELSWKNICGKAEIILPRNVKDFDRQKVKDVFQRGDKVEIYLCYDGDLKLDFSGYIDQVSADIPINIKLEDEMWKLKQIPVNFSSPNISLKGFFEKVVKDYPLDIDAHISLGAVRFTKVTLGEVLNKLQSDMNIYTFIRNGKLSVAKPYSDVKDDKGVFEEFDLERNCVSNDLNYISAESRLVKIIGQTAQNVAKAVKAKEKDKKLKFEYGDNNANETINWTFNVKTKKELEEAVKDLYKKKKKDGFDGSFTTFGIPSVQHGQKVKLTSSLYEDRQGTYYIDRVKKTFRKDSGYRQEIGLGFKAF